jgi:hypothetical protein
MPSPQMGTPHALVSEHPTYRGSIFQTETQRENLLSGLLDWLVSHIELFDLVQQEDIEGDTPEGILPDRSRKAFAELGAALRIANRVPKLCNRSDIAELRTSWLEIAQSRNIFFDASRRIHLYPHNAMAFAVFREFNLEPSGIHRMLQNVLDRGWIDATERSAWHKLDLKYIFDAAGLQHSFPSASDLFKQSSLINPPSLPYATRADLYGVTHLIFHLADFGRVDLNRVAGSGYCLEIADYVRTALAMCLYERDFDLVAELLIDLICMKNGQGELCQEASLALCECQNTAGFLPDLAWLAGLPQEESNEANARAEFLAVYHPTVVGLFLVATDMYREQELSIT